MPIHTKMTVDWQGLDGSTFRKLPWNFFFLIQPPNTLLPSHPIVSSPFTPVSSALSQSLLSDHSIQVQDFFFFLWEADVWQEISGKNISRVFPWYQWPPLAMTQRSLIYLCPPALWNPLAWAPISVLVPKGGAGGLGKQWPHMTALCGLLAFYRGLQLSQKALWEERVRGKFQKSYWFPSAWHFFLFSSGMQNTRKLCKVRLVWVYFEGDVLHLDFGDGYKTLHLSKLNTAPKRVNLTICKFRNKCFKFVK